MKALSLLILILATTAHTKNFTLTKDNWIANIHIEQCDEYQCEGKSRIELNTGNYQQVFTSDNAFINSQNKNIPFQFSDFLNPADYNFDGKTDIAISQGNYGLYGSTIYNIYVQTNTGKFILSDELSDLTLD